MDEQEDTSKDELNLATEEDEVADTEATDTEDQETESEDEQEQDTLELDSEVDSTKNQEKGKAELAKEKLVEDWARKVKRETKTLDDIPEDQSWLKPLVKAKLSDKIDDNVIDKKLDERENVRKFESLKSELNSMGITKEQKSTLEGKYKFLREKGLSQLDALLTSMEMAGVNPDEMALDAKRYAARLRTPGTYKKGEADPADLESKEGFGAVSKQVDPDKAFEYLKKQL